MVPAESRTLLKNPVSSPQVHRGSAVRRHHRRLPLGDPRDVREMAAVDIDIHTSCTYTAFAPRRFKEAVRCTPILRFELKTFYVLSFKLLSAEKSTPRPHTDREFLSSRRKIGAQRTAPVNLRGAKAVYVYDICISISTADISRTSHGSPRHSRR